MLTMILTFSSLSKYWSLNMCDDPRTTILPLPICQQSTCNVVKTCVTLIVFWKHLPKRKTLIINVLLFVIFFINIQVERNLCRPTLKDVILIAVLGPSLIRRRILWSYRGSLLYKKESKPTISTHEVRQKSSRVRALLYSLCFDRRNRLVC